MPIETFSQDADLASAGLENPQAYLNADARIATVAGKQSYTIDQAASQIVRGDPGWSAMLGLPATVTYAFRSTAPARYPDDAGGFSRDDFRWRI